LRAFGAGLGFPLSFDLATVEARPAMVAERARVSMRRAAYRGQSTRRGYGSEPAKRNSGMNRGAAGPLVSILM